MTTDQVLEKVLSNTYVKADCFMRLLVARDFVEHVRYGENAADGGLVAQLQGKYLNRPEGVAAAAVAAWGDDVLESLSAGTISETFSELTSRIAALPELVLYAPVRLSSESLDRIGGWCRQYIDNRVLIDTRLNPEVVGGCAFVWKDRYYDFSLPYFIQKYKHDFSSMLNRLEGK
jgi:hypothetical protein